jgi:hypothetical protein
MVIPTDVATQTALSGKLQRIRRVSRPLTLLISIALALAVVVPVMQAGVLLLFDQIGSPAGYVSFSAWGPGLGIGDLRAPPPPTLVPIASLTPYQRLVFSGLTLLCGTCTALVLFQLRALFALYSRGIVFGPENARRIKRFGLWLVASAIVVNLSGRIFTAVVHAPREGIANAALTVVYGAMIYVIAYVMELGREADLERRDFI